MNWAFSTLVRAQLEKEGQSSMKVDYSWYRGFKKTLSCIDCGASFPDCPQIIQFHHENGKKSECIAKMMAQNRPNKEVWAEIRKCIPLCANCHVKRHHRRSS